MLFQQELLISYYFITLISSILCFQPGIISVGRWNDSVADWSATALKLSILSSAVESPEVHLSFNYCGTCKYYIDVSINCKSFQIFPISNTTSNINFTIVSHTLGGRYDITITKRSEPNTGVMMIDGIRILNSEIITGDLIRNRCDDFKRKMIVIGDSINIGYGVEGEDPCPYSVDTENVLHAYGYLTATRLSSLVNIIAWSGRGVVRNYGEAAGEVGSLTVPQLYNHTLAASPSSAENFWDPNGFQVLPLTE